LLLLFGWWGKIKSKIPVPKLKNYYQIERYTSFPWFGAPKGMQLLRRDTCGLGARPLGT
jgi:hypothetical protein